MKGQGLPDRLRKDAYEMKKVQDYIEETDILLAIEDGIHPGELNCVVQKVFDMYNTARDTAEMNHPSNYAHQMDGPVPDPEDPRQGQQGRHVGHDGTEDDGGNDVGIRTVQREATNGTMGTHTSHSSKFVIS